MKTNIFKVIVMTIAICTAASNIAIAQGHGHGRSNARMEHRSNGSHNNHSFSAPHSKGHSNHGSNAFAKPHGYAHDRHMNRPQPHHNGIIGGPHHRPMYYSHHRYTPVRRPHLLPHYVHYRSYDILPSIGAILTDLPLNAIEVMINGNYYYSALGLLFRPFYIDGIMHFEVMRPF